MIRKNGVNPATVSPLDRLSFLGERTLEDASAQLARDAGPDMPDTHSFDLGTRLVSMGGARVDTSADSEAPLPTSPRWGEEFRRRFVRLLDRWMSAVWLPSPSGGRAGEGGWGRANRPSTLDATPGAFGIARFDVEEGLRVPVHTLVGALQVDFRLPSAVDYTTLLRATRLFTRDEHEVRKAYERAVFNVVFHNRDDHAKNVSFRLGRDRSWRLAPCYDLTFSEGPGGEHQMDVCGEGRDITRAHLLMLASQGGLDRAWATTVVERMVELAGRFSTIAAGRSIRQATVKRVRSAIEANRLRLA